MKYERFDHCVLTVADIDATIDFYERVLDMEVLTWNGRKALRFANSKINLHEVGKEIEPTALRPGPGTEHLCFVVSDPLEEVIDAIKKTDTLRISRWRAVLQAALHARLVVAGNDAELPALHELVRREEVSARLISSAEAATMHW